MKNIFVILLFTLLAFQADAVEKRIEADDLVIGKQGVGAADPKLKFRGTNQQLRANKTTGKLEFSNDGSVFKNIGSGSGSGSGGINILTNSGFEDGISDGWTSSGGTFALDTTTELYGDNSASFDASAGSQYFQSSVTAIPEILKGKACQASIKYKGGDANLTLKVLDGSAAALVPAVSLTLETATSVYLKSVFFTCPSSGSLILRVESSANAAIAYFDEMYLGELQNLAETTTPDTFSALVSAASPGVVSQENVDWINGNCTRSGTNNHVATCTFTSGIFTVAPNCTASISSTLDDRGLRVNATASNVVVRTFDGAAFESNDFTIFCQKSSPDAKQSVQVYRSVPKTTEVLNDFSAKVSNADAVTDESVDWINGNCTNATTGQATCNFNAGVFSSAPNCQASLLGDATNSSRTIKIDSITSSAITVRTLDDVDSANDFAFVLSCQKSGSDYRTPIVQPIVSFKYGELVGVSSQPKEYIQNFECKVTSSVGTALGDSMISSVGNLSSGNCTLALTAGKFTATPFCTAFSTETTAAATTLQVGMTSSTAGTIYCRAGAGNCASGVAGIMRCIGY